MPRPFDKTARDKVMDALHQADLLVHDGVDRDEAIAKVARDMRLEPDFVSRVVHAHNIGQATSHRETCDDGDVVCKLADHPLASVDRVMELTYPDNVKTAGELRREKISSEYLLPPKQAKCHGPKKKKALPKTASTNLFSPMSGSDDDEDEDAPVIPGATASWNSAKIAENAAMHSQLQARDRFLTAMGSVCDYFRRTDAKVAFSEADHYAPMLFGDPARHVMDYVSQRNYNGRVKRASETQRPTTPAYADKAPYSLIAEAIKTADAWLDAQRALEHATEKRAAAEDAALRPFVPSPVPPVLRNSKAPLSVPSLIQTKHADFMSSVIGGTIGGAASENALMRPSSDLVQSTTDSLSDPDHLQALQKIQAQTSLSDLMANDDVIQGYDPVEVADAYNEIAQLSPRIALQPAVLRSVLRKRLATGTLEPFEAQQLVDMNKDLNPYRAEMSPKA